MPAIFATPPYPRPALTEGQTAFYRQRLIKRLEEYEALTAQDSRLSLPASRARLLYRQLTGLEGAKRPAGPLIQLAREVHELEQSVERINRQLAGAEQLSRERQAELQGLSERERLLAEQILDLKDRKRSLEREQAIAKEENTKVENTLGRLAEDLERASQVRGKVELAKRLESLLERVKGQLRREKRKDLEAAYRRHLADLLDSNRLLHSVEIDAHFLIRYRNEAGEPVPMSSISAGMKQLSATALLWALKEVSGREVPLIIDTPLGRIDRHHQENLLRNYYPRAGRQVILLVTDSEIDDRKRDLIRPHVYREYNLENVSGEETRFTRAEVGAHG